MIHSIDRKNDPRLEVYQHVGDPAWLEQRGLFVAEGRLVVDRLMANREWAIESVLLTPAAHRSLEHSLASVEVVYVADQSIVNAVTGFNFHRGCLAIAHRPRAPRPLSSFAGARRVIALEGVGNPDNLGGIFRSSVALGADGVILDRSTADPLYRKAVRTSMGAVLRLPFTRAEPWVDGLRALKTMGLAIVALTPAGSLTLDEYADRLTPSDRIALLAGAEGSGLSREALESSDVTVRIPIDPRSDSLNVVVAVSIALQRCHVRN